MIKISVIVPCYNSQFVIDRLFSCFLKQTIGFENLQIIFVDDYSIDDTIQILHNYQQQFPENVVVLQNMENRGVSYSRNRGLEVASSRYVTYADHDDWIEADLYEKMYARMEQYHPDMVLCAHDFVKVPHQEKTVSVGEDILFQLENNEQRCEFMLAFRNELECWSKLINKDFLTRNVISFPEGMWGEDFYWWSLSEMYLGTVYWISEILYHHMPQEKSLRKDMQNWMSAQLLLNETAKARGLYDEFKQVLDLELYEVGFASTVYYWILGGNTSVGEIEGLRKCVLEYAENIWQNPYVLGGDNWRYLYSQCALELLKGEVTVEKIKDFLQRVIIRLRG